jgi:hypothetical protein
MKSVGNRYKPPRIRNKIEAIQRARGQQAKKYAGNYGKDRKHGG